MHINWSSIIALGPYAISVMGNNQNVVDQLINYSNDYSERCWQLPLFDDYKDLLKSDVADILNANEGRRQVQLQLQSFWKHLSGKRHGRI